MHDTNTFLTQQFLQSQRGIAEPDGRQLHLYKCEDDEFWYFVELLRKCGPPKGHDFDEYRKRWSVYRNEIQTGRRQARFDALETSELDWIVRVFVLYASELWLRFMNEDWRNRNFPDGLPFEKLTWLQFLSLIDWTELYRETITGYFRVLGTRLHFAHACKLDRADASTWINSRAHTVHVERERPADAGHYPGLYFPMLRAWNWWRVAPLRLPTSIRYLDTFALQGGAADRLVVECEKVNETELDVRYRSVRPPNGYGDSGTQHKKRRTTAGN